MRYLHNIPGKEGTDMASKRIAVLIAQANENTQAQFLEGVFEESFKHDTDVCVFSMYRKYQNSVMREKGESNIYNLIEPSKFDAFILAKDTIQTPGVIEAFEKKLSEEYNGPVVCIDVTSKYFPSVINDSYIAEKALIAHLIEVHGYKDIAFLGGKKWHPHTIERVNAYKDSLLEHGLPVREDRIFYGDFWYDSGSVCAEQLISAGGKLPEAIACANDCMAIGMCEEFEKRGIKVPDDIAVIGFDSIEDGKCSPVPITSSPIPARYNGRQAADFVLSALYGREYKYVPHEPELFIGRSCGCENHDMSHLLRPTWETGDFSESFYSINNNMLEDLIMQNTLNDYLSVLYSYKYQLNDYAQFHLCLNDQWASPISLKNKDLFSTGYSARMLQVLKTDRRNPSLDFTGISKSFPVEKMLPELFETFDSPRAYIFTPIQFEGNCYGYAVLVKDTPESYTDSYMHWITNVSDTLEIIRRMEIYNHMISGDKKGIEKIKDFAAVRKSDMDITPESQEEIHAVEEILDNNLFTYHFQPIVRAEDATIFGYEALMRSASEKNISPLDILRYAGFMDRLADIEKATFLNILSIKKQKKDLFTNKTVFINSIPGIHLLTDDIQKIESALSEHSNQVVVEFTEQAELNDIELENSKNHYRSMGIGIAVDDYGTGYSNVSNLLRYMPDCVKIDRSLISNIQNSPQKQHFVREIIRFSHDNNILALAEGVETTEELHTVILLGVDLIQGYYTAKPSPEIIDKIPDGIQSEILSFIAERNSGIGNSVYYAGQTNKIMMHSLANENYNHVSIGGGKAAHKDLFFIGSPGESNELTMEFSPGFSGYISLENVSLVSNGKLPCITIGENCDVAISLTGNNSLSNGGILVPKSSSLTFMGDGDLTIDVNTKNFFGIGNEIDKKHGVLNFSQDGKIVINEQGVTGTAIGSGLGGEIHIRSGQYEINQHGNIAVGIGALSAPVKLSISSCNLNIDQSLFKGVGIGSLEEESEINMELLFCQIKQNAVNCFGLGSLTGRKTSITIKHASLFAYIQGEAVAAIGTLTGDSYFVADHMDCNVNVNAPDGYAFGNEFGNTSIVASDSRINVTTLINKSGIEVKGGESAYELKHAGLNVTVNGEIIRHIVT